MSNYDEFNLDIIQTNSTGNDVSPDTVASWPCITSSCTFGCTDGCSEPATCGTGCQITTGITVK